MNLFAFHILRNPFRVTIDEWSSRQTKLSSLFIAVKSKPFWRSTKFLLILQIYVCWAVKPLQRYSNLHPAHCSTTITNHWILKLCHKITGDKRWKMAFLRGNRKLLRPAMLRMSLITFVYWRLPNWIKQTGAAFNSHNIIAEKRRGSKRI